MENKPETIKVHREKVLSLFYGLEIKDKLQIQELMKLGVLHYTPTVNWFVTIQYPVANWNLQALSKLTSQQLFDLYLRLKK